MLLFYKANLAFLSMPKTGTTAYETALRGHADIVLTGPSSLKHLPVYRYDRFIRPMLLRLCDAELETLAVMREPISWLGSWWRYRQRPFLNGKPKSTLGVSFDHFVLAYMKGNKPEFANVGSQARFLRPKQNGTSVTHLFRYEDQPCLQEFLIERLGISFNLGRENVSPTAPLNLSSDIEHRFRRKFHEEFTLYESISEKT